MRECLLCRGAELIPFLRQRLVQRLVGISGIVEQLLPLVPFPFAGCEGYKEISNHVCEFGLNHSKESPVLCYVSYLGDPFSGGVGVSIGRFLLRAPSSRTWVWCCEHGVVIRAGVLRTETVLVRLHT